MIHNVAEERQNAVLDYLLRSLTEHFSHYFERPGLAIVVYHKA